MSSIVISKATGAAVTPYQMLSAVCSHDGHQHREMARATELNILQLKPLSTSAQVGGIIQSEF